MESMPPNARVLRRIQGQLYSRVLRPFLADRARSALAHLVDRPRQPGWMRHRVWLQEAVPAGAVRVLRTPPTIGARPRSFEPLDRLRGELEPAGMRAVFVLTPLNEELVRRFAAVHPPDAILRDIRRTVGAVRQYLEERGAPVIDLTDTVPSECFFDLVHVNTCGDELMAKRIAEWLNQDSQRAVARR